MQQGNNKGHKYSIHFLIYIGREIVKEEKLFKNIKEQYNISYGTASKAKVAFKAYQKCKEDIRSNDLEDRNLLNQGGKDDQNG